MRFVSVVVPDWLIATTSVSRMSARSPKPGQLGGGQGLDPEAAVAGWLATSARGQALAGDVRRCPGR